ncbi:MAG: hypothetical protein HDS71_07015 [Bacteroidales bacterium]|nr:hypothetical protein [Bacteroidales bacterium]MBD5223782.1 hypothetical protein [Bacteroidales bacterium]MBD5301805.1 hypothetical protein [Bacteroides sp.]
MVYRFKLVSDEVSNFSREIEIDSENTFLQLRNAILESVNYTKDELDSFFLCNEDWEREDEITLEDMGTSASDQDLWLMENTPLNELIDDEGQKLVFVFDYMTERSFFMELKEMIPSRSLVEPVCTIKRGKAPNQFIDLDEFDKSIDAKTQQVASIEDMDFEPMDQNAFNDEELEDGFDIMDDDI